MGSREWVRLSSLPCSGEIVVSTETSGGSRRYCVDVKKIWTLGDPVTLSAGWDQLYMYMVWPWWVILPNLVTQVLFAWNRGIPCSKKFDSGDPTFLGGDGVDPLGTALPQLVTHYCAKFCTGVLSVDRIFNWKFCFIGGSLAVISCCCWCTGRDGYQGAAVPKP